MRSKIAHVLGATIIFGTGSGKTCDLDRIARQAHILVSTVGNLGAVQTSALAREVEHFCRAGNPVGLAPFLD